MDPTKPKRISYTVPTEVRALFDSYSAAHELVHPSDAMLTAALVTRGLVQFWTSTPTRLKSLPPAVQKELKDIAKQF